MSVSPKNIIGIVVSAGKMQRAVTVRVGKQVYDSWLRKHFKQHQKYLVSDPNDSLRLGDVVQIEPAGRKISRHIKHVVSKIIAPWGTPIEERAPVLTAEERDRIMKEKYEARLERRAEKRRLQSAIVDRASKVLEKREGSREARKQVNMA